MGFFFILLPVSENSALRRKAALHELSVILGVLPVPEHAL